MNESQQNIYNYMNKLKKNQNILALCINIMPVDAQSIKPGANML